MRPVAYRVRCLLRARWRATSALGLAVAAVGDIVLTLAAGAARTSTARTVYTAASGGGFDAEIQQGGGPPRTAEVASLTGALSVESVTFLFGPARPRGEATPGTGQARIGPVTLGLAGMAPVRGDMAPMALSGRAPSADDETGLGRLAVPTLGADVVRR